MPQDDSHAFQFRLVGAIAGIGSGLTKVAVGHGSPDQSKLTDLVFEISRGSDVYSRRISFDTIKTRVQCAPPAKYSGAFDVLFKIVRYEGISALYKGATPPAVGWAAIDSVLLGSLHNYRLFLVRHGMTEISPTTGQPRLTILGHGIAGMFAGCTSALIATPIEHLKVKLQLQSQRMAKDRQFKSPLDCARQIIRVQGLGGLWSGFTASLAFRSNFFWMFLFVEILMRYFSTFVGTPYEISTGTAHFLSGGLGSFVYWGMAIPADNIKSRMMAHPYPLQYPTSERRVPATVLQRPSFFFVANQIYSRHGLIGFFRGLGPCFLRTFPVNASALFVYEETMRILGAEKTRS